jgi:hypothetical protein
MRGDPGNGTVRYCTSSYGYPWAALVSRLSSTPAAPIMTAEAPYGRAACFLPMRPVLFCMLSSSDAASPPLLGLHIYQAILAFLHKRDNQYYSAKGGPLFALSRVLCLLPSRSIRQAFRLVLRLRLRLLLFLSSLLFCTSLTHFSLSLIFALDIGRQPPSVQALCIGTQLFIQLTSPTSLYFRRRLLRLGKRPSQLARGQTQDFLTDDPCLSQAPTALTLLPLRSLPFDS